MTSPRRFPPPWSVVEIAAGYMIVDGHNRPLAYVYADAERRGVNNDALTPDEARRIAAGIARLPELMGKAKGEG